MNKLVIIDDLIIDDLGHHYYYAKAVSGECKKQNIPCQIIVNSQLPKELVTEEILPIFPYNPKIPLFTLKRLKSFLFGRSKHNSAINNSPLKKPSKWVARVDILNVLYLNFSVFLSLLKIQTDKDTVIFNDTHKYASYGVYFWLKFRQYKKVVFFIRHEDYPPMLLRTLNRAGYREFGTDSPLLRDRFPFSSTVYPSLMSTSFDRSKLTDFKSRYIKEPIPGTLSIGMFGMAREEKGIEFITKFLELSALNDQLQENEFTYFIQCNLLRTASAKEKDCVRRLQEVAKLFPKHVYLIEDALSQQDYYSFINSMDIGLFPYNIDRYKAGTSGIFSETIAMGKPVIIPEDTWMHKSIFFSGSYKLITKDDFMSYYLPLYELRRDFDKLKLNAQALCEIWNNTHNPQNYLKKLAQ